ncbi:MAG TPA: aldehyde dehydrogenase family protein, partial [Candidatus Dormibacteraeota bacterium]|nr:aldehyde dehydrogenase family protein [Candidatus Dormibacteraeota bacterium]
GKVHEDAMIEVGTLAAELAFWTRHAPRYLAEERIHSLNPFVLGKKLRVRYVPRQVAGIIAPWNYPVALGIGDSVPALAAGCGVVLKPSEVTPMSALLLERALRECGVPEGVFQVATGRGETGAALVDEADVIMFTGSTATGRKVLERAARTLTPVSVELGGKDPLIVLADADLERAANTAVYGAMVNSGQVCMSTERVYVEAPVYDEFVRRVVEKVGRLRQGPPGGPGTAEVGGITFAPQLETIERHVRDAVERGARVLTGGHRRPGPGQFFEPTVLVDVDGSMACLREETFGPLLPIVRVADADEAVRQANDSSYGLCASLFTRDMRRGERLAARMHAGTVSINDILAHYLAMGMPMGGLKSSGIGARHGAEGIRKFCERRALCASRWHLRRDLHTYPYSPATTRLLLRTLRLMYGRRWGLGR